MPVSSPQPIKAGISGIKMCPTRCRSRLNGDWLFFFLILSWSSFPSPKFFDLSAVLLPKFGLMFLEFVLPLPAETAFGLSFSLRFNAPVSADGFPAALLIFFPANSVLHSLATLSAFPGPSTIWTSSPLMITPLTPGIFFKSSLRTAPDVTRKRRRVIQL